MDYLGWLLMTRSAHIHVMGVPIVLCVSLCQHGYIGILRGSAGMGYRNTIIHVVSGPLSNLKSLDVQSSNLSAQAFMHLSSFYCYFVPRGVCPFVDFCPPPSPVAPPSWKSTLPLWLFMPSFLALAFRFVLQCFTSSDRVVGLPCWFVDLHFGAWLALQVFSPVMCH